MFKVGDLVKLKSGGAKMVVRCILGDGTHPTFEEPYRLGGSKDGDVLCEWQDGKTPRAQTYDPAQLEHYGAGHLGATANSLRRR
jgi:uncharacterized protein YodC (DUF2158 family)